MSLIDVRLVVLRWHLMFSVNRRDVFNQKSLVFYISTSRHDDSNSNYAKPVSMHTISNVLNTF